MYALWVARVSLLFASLLCWAAALRKVTRSWLKNGIITTSKSDTERWRRLECYARFKRRRFALTSLPGDLMLAVVRHIVDYDDLRHLLEALVGFRPSLWNATHLQAIPIEVRAAFVVRASLHEFETHLRALAESALYHCRDCHEVIVLADWSAFSKTVPTPILRVRWTSTMQRDVQISHIHTLFWSAMRRSVPVVRLTLHSVLHWQQRHVFNKDPLATHTHTLFPHTLLMHG